MLRVGIVAAALLAAGTCDPVGRACPSEPSFKVLLRYPYTGGTVEAQGACANARRIEQDEWTVDVVGDLGEDCVVTVTTDKTTTARIEPLRWSDECDIPYVDGMIFF